MKPEKLIICYNGKDLISYGQPQLDLSLILAAFGASQPGLLDQLLRLLLSPMILG